MPHHRVDIDEEAQEAILEELDNGASIHATAIKWGVGDTTIRRIRDGLRNPKTGRIPKEDLCHCCHFRVIDRSGGLTRLCRYCFEHAESGEIGCHRINFKQQGPFR